MKTVYLHGKLGKRFGKKWELAVDNAEEAFSAIEANCEGFFDYVFKSSAKGIDYIILTKDPKSIKDENDLRENIIDEKLSKVNLKQKEIHILNPVGGSTVFIPTAKAIYAAIKASAILKAIATVVITTAISQALAKTPKSPERKDPVTTKSFLLAGARTRQAQGIAVPVGYGRLKIGATNVATRKTSKKLTDSAKAETLESYTEMEFVDLLSEGPIHGFVDKYGVTLPSDDIFEAVYVNDVQVRNSPAPGQDVGSYNYVLNENQYNRSGKPDHKLGAEDESKILSEGVFYIKEYDTLIYGPPPYRELRYGIQGAIDNDAKVFSHFVNNSAVNEVTFSFRAEISIQADNGEVNANSVAFAILISTRNGDYNVLEPNSSRCKIKRVGDGIKQVKNFDAFNEALRNDSRYTPDPNNAPNGSRIVATLLNAHTAQELTGKYSDVDQAHFVLSGIATSTYQFDITIEIDRTYDSSNTSDGITFKVIKLSPEYDPSVKGDDFGGVTRTRRLQLAHIEEKISENLIYPHSAMARIVVDSKNFSQAPDRLYHVKLKKVLVPSNYDPVSRKYEGPWNGLFKGQTGSDMSIHTVPDSEKYWTDNPAWIFFDLLHNARYGVGKYGLEEENIDKWQLYKIAKYCDELVETDYPIETSNGQPQPFVCDNIVIENTDPTQMEIRIMQIEGKETEYQAIDSANSYTLKSFDGSTEEDKALRRQLFVSYFGDDKTFAGKKVAFFIHQSTADLSDGEKAYRSAAREGEFTIEERVIISSDPDSFTVIVSGPKFATGKTVGACATQINHPTVEPRFSANLYLTDRAEAFEVIKNLASMFRGMSAYSGGKILAVQDSIKHPIQLFNSSNVNKDGFTYVGVQKNKKITACMVRFNNEAKNYKPDLVYEEDADAIQKFGYIENETMGLGITSESQARRFAKWILLTSQLETESVKFTAGQEASYLFPGSVFEISDETRVGKSKSGRILDIGSSRELKLNEQTFTYNDSYILLDKSIQDDPVLSKVELTICVGASNSTQENLESRAPSENDADDQDQEMESIFTPQIYKFEARIGRAENVKKGPQGQTTIAYNLLLKIPFDVDSESNRLKKFEHGFETGDKIIFKSDGVLPGGLDKTRIFFVVNETKHTFQVSLDNPNSNSNYSVVNVLDKGRDFLLNEGGLHYFCSYSETNTINSVTQEALDQISIGVPYSIKGLISTSSSEEIDSISLKSALQIDGIVSDGWAWSDIFGRVYIGAGNELIFSRPLNSWINIKNLLEQGISGNAWFYSYGLGWVWINQVGENYFWYIQDEGEWIFVKKYSKFFYRYNSDTSGINIGSVKTISNTDIFVKNVIQNDGYYFSLIEDSNEYDSNEPSDVLDDSISVVNPGFRSTDISDIVSVDKDESIQGFQSLRVVLSQGHGLDILKNNVLTISGFTSPNASLNQLLNDRWTTIFVNDNVVELIDSGQVAQLIDGAQILSNGSVSFVESATSIVERYLEGQMFRTLSVKEISDNQYEVTGLEYNASKFDAVDKKGIIKKPHLPIPPQADMNIPEAPTQLILNDLTV